jgi:hypothetical protein
MFLRLFMFSIETLSHALSLHQLLSLLHGFSTSERQFSIYTQIRALPHLVKPVSGSLDRCARLQPTYST